MEIISHQTKANDPEWDPLLEGEPMKHIQHKGLSSEMLTGDPTQVAVSPSQKCNICKDGDSAM